MQLYYIKKDQFQYFSHLDPFNVIDKEMKGTPVYMGLVNKEASGYVAVGVMIGCYTQYDFEIHWLFVDPDYRYHSCGERFLAAVFDEAIKKKLDSVVCFFDDYPNREAICEGERQYFEMNGFVSEGANEMSISVNDYIRQLITPVSIFEFDGFEYESLFQEGKVSHADDNR